MSKRVKNKQISQLDPNPLSDDEEGGEQMGTFQKADETVLKGRRIVSARRRGKKRQPAEAPAAAASGEEDKPKVSWDLGSFAQGNGFGAGDTKKDDGNAPKFDFGTGASAEPLKFDFGAAAGGEGFSFGGTNPTPTSDASTGGDFSFGATTADSGGGAEFNFGAGGGFDSNPSTGGFGSVAFGGGDSAATGGNSSFGFTSGGGGGGGGDGEDDDAANPEDFTPMMGGEPVVQVEEVAVTTGEEGEKQSFPAVRSKLFEMDQGSWAERGVGKVSVNVLVDDESKARILFRNEQVGTIRMNVAIFGGMKAEMANEKGVRIPAIVDGKVTQYYVKFAKPLEASEFLAEVEKRIQMVSGSSTSSSSNKKKEVKRADPVEHAAPENPVQPKKVKETPVEEPVAGPSFAVGVLDEQGVAGVITVTQQSKEKLLVEGTLQGLKPGLEYEVQLEGEKVGAVQGATDKAVMATTIPARPFFGKRLSLVATQGGLALETSLDKEDLE